MSHWFHFVDLFSSLRLYQVWFLTYLPIGLLLVLHSYQRNKIYLHALLPDMGIRLLGQNSTLAYPIV
jgi:hypothetical protein